MREFSVYLIFLLLSSCYLFKGNGIDYKIINNSKHEMKQVVFTTSEEVDSILIGNVKPNETKSGFLRMLNTETDGSYVLKYVNRNNEKMSCVAGYYTNGLSLDNWIRYEIREDTTLVATGDYP